MAGAERSSRGRGAAGKRVKRGGDVGPPGQRESNPADGARGCFSIRYFVSRDKGLPGKSGLQLFRKILGQRPPK